MVSGAKLEKRVGARFWRLNLGHDGGGERPGQAELARETALSMLFE